MAQLSDVGASEFARDGMFEHNTLLGEDTEPAVNQN